VLLSALTVTAAAPSIDARSELQRAAEALKAKSYDEAISRLRRVAEADAEDRFRWRAEAGLGLAYGEQGNRIASEFWWRQFLASTGASASNPAWKAQRELALQRIAAHRTTLLKTHGVVLLAPTPSNANVTLVPTPAVPLPGRVRRLYLLAGPHKVTVSAPGFIARTVSVRVNAGVENPPLAVTLTPVPTKKPPIEKPPVLPPAKPDAPTSDPTMLVAGGVLVGVGALGLVAGALLNSLALDDQSELQAISAKGTVAPEERNRFFAIDDRMHARAGAAYAIYAVSGIAVVTGVSLLILDATDDADDSSAQVQVGISRFGAMVTLTSGL